MEVEFVLSVELFRVVCTFNCHKRGEDNTPDACHNLTCKKVVEMVVKHCIGQVLLLLQLEKLKPL